jgi:hypothetical protein
MGKEEVDQTHFHAHDTSDGGSDWQLHRAFGVLGIIPPICFCLQVSIPVILGQTEPPGKKLAVVLAPLYTFPLREISLEAVVEARRRQTRAER